MREKAGSLAGLSLAILPILLTAACATTIPTATQTPTEVSSTAISESQAPVVVSPQSTVSAEPSPVAEAGLGNSLAALLEKLEIAPEYTSGYDRDLFDHWIDADRDGCNTRREVLIVESLTPIEISSGCDLVGGSWLSQYDAMLSEDFSSFDIDHMVPLKEAWDSGAHAWDYETRMRFANDLDFPGSLIAVTASSNRSKSDRDPAQWLPAQSSYLCEYTANWLSVKYRWKLSIDSDESLALGSLVAACDDYEVQLPPRATIAIGQKVAADANGNDPKFGSCKEAKANGFGPYQKGVDEEYLWYRDGDSDGKVCE